jgi:hypothetical protein
MMRRRDFTTLLGHAQVYASRTLNRETGKTFYDHRFRLQQDDGER